jgi:hypothetical protein
MMGHSVRLAQQLLPVSPILAFVSMSYAVTCNVMYV